MFDRGCAVLKGSGSEFVDEGISGVNDCLPGLQLKRICNTTVNAPYH